MPTTEWGWFISVAERYGIPTAIFLVVGIANYREIWVWGTTYRAAVKTVTDKFTEAIAELHKRIEREEKDHSQKLQAMTEDRDFWRDAYFEVAGIGKQLAKQNRPGRFILTRPRS
jgi:hypothetical protein